MPGGRPREYDRQRLAAEFASYIRDTDLPIIADFAYLHDVPRELLYDWEEFSTLLKRCTAKKETDLERGMLGGRYPPSAAIFSLKQLGWSDKQETVHKGDAAAPIVISATDSKL